jgi:hypothetical protein
MQNTTKNFKSLKTMKHQKKDNAIKHPPTQGEQRYMVTDKLKLDDVAFDGRPDDFEIYPVTVKSDGDCIPSYAFIFWPWTNYRPGKITYHTRVLYKS